MKMHLIILLLFGLVVQGCAQVKDSTKNPNADSSINKNRKPLRYIPGVFSNLYVDALENMYVITATQQLKKLTPKGDSITVYNNVKKYGNPSLVDVTNPLKILIYYKNFTTVNFLDQLLTFRSSTNLRTAGIFQASAVATSYDNYIWIFDEQDFKLKKLDEDGKILLQGNDLRTEINEAPEAVFIKDNEYLVYVYDFQQGFYVFDYYGAYKNKIPFPGWENTGVQDGILYGFTAGLLHTYETKTRVEKTYSIPTFFAPYKTIRVQNGKIYLLKEDGIYVYPL